jgi:hypothetical protein
VPTLWRMVLAANLAFFLTLPEADRGKAKANFGQGIAVPRAAVRVLRCVRRLR